MDWSDETCRMFGIAPGEFVPDIGYFGTFLHPDDRALVEAAHKRAMEDDGVYSVDYRIVRRDGEIRYLHSDGEVTFDDAGRPLRMTGTNQDITDRKRVEEALRESEERYREVFDDAEWRTDT